MAKSPESRPALPYNPLIFSTPLRPAGAELPGAAILPELPPPHALLAWDVLRAVHLFAGGAAGRAWWPAERMRAWEESILLDPSLPEPVRSPLAVIVGQLADPAAASPDRIAAACLVLCDWAVEIAAPETTLAWAQAAALVCPENPRLAWIAGKLFRKEGRFDEAKHWLRRAIRLAVWRADQETQVRALITLGNLYLHIGAHPQARKVHQRALRIAQRYHLRDQEPMILHDLFVIAVNTGDFAEAERLGRRVLLSYGPGHTSLPPFTHDLAYFWVARGRFQVALLLLMALIPHFKSIPDRLRVLSTAVRAAASVHERSSFEELWIEAARLAELPEARSTLASSLLEMGYGASSLRMWDRAREAFHEAMLAAESNGESDILLKAEAALVKTEALEVAEPIVRSDRRVATDERKRFAEEVIRALPSADPIFRQSFG